MSDNPPAQSARDFRLLTWLIRANAAILLLAMIPMLFQPEWMSQLHSMLGLGTLNVNPLIEYLTRSASACYALHGGVLLALSTDVRRYQPLIPWVYVGHLVFAGVMVAIDLYAGMPWWWTLAEGGTITVVAVLILGVSRRCQPK